MPAVAAIKETFDRDGFVVVEGVFSVQEVAAAKEEVRRVIRLIREERETAGIPYKANGVCVGLSIRSELFRRINADPRLVEPLAECIGPNIEFWSDKIVYKSADVDFGSPWHQDYPYWKGTNKFSAWIALDDATPENGCLRMIPGSHKSFVEHGGADTEGVGFVNRMKDGAVDERQAVDVRARAGDAVIFHDLTLHSSYPNKSGRDRWALISTYRDASKDDLAYEFTKARFMVKGVRTGRDCLGESGR